MKNNLVITAIHGAGMHAGIFGTLATHLTEYLFQPVNLPGHVDDTHKPFDSIAANAAWMKHELAGRAEGSTVLLGHSMGALVALALHHHPVVRALVLLGAAPAMPVNPELLQMARQNPAEAAGLIAKWGVFQGNPQVGALRTSMGDIMHHAKPAAIYADLKACDDAGSMAEVAARITKPLLVISGDQDKMARASEGAKLANMAEHGEYALIADCGHMMMIEKPVETALYIKRFIDGLSGESI